MLKSLAPTTRTKFSNRDLSTKNPALCTLLTLNQRVPLWEITARALPQLTVPGLLQLGRDPLTILAARSRRNCRWRLRNCVHRSTKSRRASYRKFWANILGRKVSKPETQTGRSNDFSSLSKSARQKMSSTRRTYKASSLSGLLCCEVPLVLGSSRFK